MKTLFLLLLPLALVLSGCAKPKIDASSDETMKSSIDAMKADMSTKEKEEFEQAMLVLSLDGKSIWSMANDPDAAKRRIGDRLDGLTADEVLSQAETVKAEREARELKQMLGEIKELKARKEMAEKARAGLRNFEILDSKFYYSDSGYTTKPIIELTVRNYTDKAVSRAYFHGTLATPGRSVPWVSEGFNYSIAGGLEPHETATWHLAPNRFGEWGDAPQDRNYMVLTVNVVRLDGADGNPFLDGEFSESDQERLDKLIMMAE